MGPTLLKVGHPDQNRQKPRWRQSANRHVHETASRSTVQSPSVTPTDDFSVVLAKWITDPNNEYFSGAMVNRIWRHYMEWWAPVNLSMT